MNDRFKFRIYNIEQQRYVATEFDKQFMLGSFVIEQCTGVKDTNDNLIYENDIVEQSPSGNKYKIIWIDTDCGWGLENAQTGFIRTMNCFDGDELEIIGNIHEQKEQQCKKQ